MKNNNNNNIKLKEPTLSFFKINSSETAGVLKTKKYVDEFFEQKFLDEYFSKKNTKKK